MDGKSRSGDASLRLQTLKLKFQLRIATIFILAIIFLGFVSFTKHGVYKAYYGGLSGLAAAVLIVQYCRERTIVQSRLSAVGIVTDYCIPFRSRSRPLNFIVSRFTPDVPRIKYSFVAFDQRTYRGQTGWGARGLYQGAYVTILYKPENPALNHPLTSFIF